MVSVRGYGGYIPRYRIKRETITEQHADPSATGEVAVPAPDESGLTMAVAAGKQALDHAAMAGEELDAVFTATTSDGFDERGLAPHVAYAVGASDDVRVGDLQGSARAGGNALLAARDAVETGRTGTALVVGTDIKSAGAGTAAERSAGSGAGAVVLVADDDGSDDEAVATLSASVQATTGFLGRYKRSGEDPVPGDGRFVRKHGYVDSVSAAVAAMRETDEADPAHAVLPAPSDGWAERAGTVADLNAEIHETRSAVGNTGAAQPLLDATLAFERAPPGETLWVAAYGPGGVDLVALAMGPGVESVPSLPTSAAIESKEYVSYAKHREYRRRAGGEA